VGGQCSKAVLIAASTPRAPHGPWAR
jgi:hypothetical protein